MVTFIYIYIFFGETQPEFTLQCFEKNSKKARKKDREKERENERKAYKPRQRDREEEGVKRGKDGVGRDDCCCSVAHWHGD